MSEATAMNDAFIPPSAMKASFIAREQAGRWARE